MRRRWRGHCRQDRWLKGEVGAEGTRKMDNVLARSAGDFEYKAFSRQMLAQDFCYGFTVASRSSRYTSDIIRHLRPNTAG
jgi:hypothetical protein